MRKVQFLAVLWTLVLAVPFTALALVGTAFVTEHLTEIASALTFANPAVWQNLVLEASARWPEVAGMIVGQLVILIILLLARREDHAQDNAAR